MSTPHLLVHDHADNVGVVVVEGLTAGTKMLCVVTHDNSSFELVSKADVPIGHKIALKDMGLLDTRNVAGHTSSPTVVDWNNDGVPDLLVGSEDGRLYYVKQDRKATTRETDTRVSAGR
mgnify:CR=1 FL=1